MGTSRHDQKNVELRRVFLVCVCNSHTMDGADSLLGAHSLTCFVLHNTSFDAALVHGLLIQTFKHAVMQAIWKELLCKFVSHKAGIIKEPPHCEKAYVGSR